MGIKKLSIQRLQRFWETRLQNREQLFERFTASGLLPSDHNLSPLELVCACSFMLETRPIFETNQCIDRFKNECTGCMLDETFFLRMSETLAEMENAGMRTQARKLRKLGHSLATAHGHGTWRSRWNNEIDSRLISAIKDEPFLPQKG